MTGVNGNRPDARRVAGAGAMPDQAAHHPFRPPGIPADLVPDGTEPILLHGGRSARPSRKRPADPQLVPAPRQQPGEPLPRGFQLLVRQLPDFALDLDSLPVRIRLRARITRWGFLALGIGLLCWVTGSGLAGTPASVPLVVAGLLGGFLVVSAGMTWFTLDLDHERVSMRRRGVLHGRGFSVPLATYRGVGLRQWRPNQRAAPRYIVVLVHPAPDLHVPLFVGPDEAAAKAHWAASAEALGLPLLESVARMPAHAIAAPDRGTRG